MIENDKQSQEVRLKTAEMPVAAVESSRRKLMAKLAAGAFAVPAVLASISTKAAAASVDP